MIVKDKITVEREQKELDDAKVTYHRNDDVVTVIGTGRSEYLEKGKEYPRTHRLVAEDLKKKGFITIK